MSAYKPDLKAFSDSVKTGLLALASIAIAIAFIETAFRFLEYDFRHQTSALHETPIYYRQPTTPTGSVFFRKSGPASWHGNVIEEGLRHAGGLSNAYANLPPSRINYDSFGLRNTQDLRDWSIVIVGDSFVELGYLEHDKLFTTIIGNQLQKPVKNVGVSHTGPLSYNHFLKAFGKADSTHDAIMVFFEGNDIHNLESEVKALATFNTSNIRPYRHIEKQTSFVRAVYELLASLQRNTSELNNDFQNAFYTHHDTKTPVSVSYTTPSSHELTKEQTTAIENAISQWGETARSLGIRPWLAFMPTKRRVLDDYLVFLDTAAPHIVEWVPNDLPDYIQNLCSTLDIEFIDLTPDLRIHTEKGILTYNPIWDTHLNEIGSLTVANTIINSMKSR